MKSVVSFPFPYYVEYIDESGVPCCETWSQAVLDAELKAGDVTITHIELAYPLRVALGMVEE